MFSSSMGFLLMMFLWGVGIVWSHAHPRGPARHFTDNELSGSDLGDMPEATLLKGVSDPHDRSVLEVQLRALKEERKRKNLLEKHGQSTVIRDRDSFTVYDCADEKAVHRPISLLEPESCSEVQLTHRKPLNVTIQVLQTGSSVRVPAYRCALSITREVSRCGYDSIHYGSIFTELDKPVHLTPMQCRKAVTSGSFMFESQLVNVSLDAPTVVSYY